MVRKWYANSGTPKTAPLTICNDVTLFCFHVDYKCSAASRGDLACYKAGLRLAEAGETVESPGGAMHEEMVRTW